MFTFAQLVGGFTFAFDIKFPAPAGRLMQAIDSANLDWIGVMPIQCWGFGQITYTTTLLLSTLVPMLFSLFFLGIYPHHHRQRHQLTTTPSPYRVTVVLPHPLRPFHPLKPLIQFHQLQP